MQAPIEIVRTTIDKVGVQDLPNAGVYIVAYLGKIIYVGKTSESVGSRLVNHCTVPSRLGVWLYRVRDWENIRLDILVPPDGRVNAWLKFAEAACINHFKPLLNMQLVFPSL